VKVCIPVAKDHGLSSVVFFHFGSAPVFLVVNTADGSVTAHPNPEALQRGRCHALDVITAEKLDAAVVGNLGAGAMDRFRAKGIPVYRVGRATAGEAVNALQAGALPELHEGTCSVGLHAHQHQHRHGQHHTS
jgi:predicted Fe-Mo cluster-binding NifX family protein